MAFAYDRVSHVRHPAAELASHLLIATALAEKAAALAPERRAEVEALIAHLEDATGEAQRLVPTGTRQGRRLLSLA